VKRDAPVRVGRAGTPEEFIIRYRGGRGLIFPAQRRDLKNKKTRWEGTTVISLIRKKQLSIYKRRKHQGEAIFPQKKKKKKMRIYRPRGGHPHLVYRSRGGSYGPPDL